MCRREEDQWRQKRGESSKVVLLLAAQRQHGQHTSHATHTSHALHTSQAPHASSLTAANKIVRFTFYYKIIVKILSTGHVHVLVHVQRRESKVMKVIHDSICSEL